MNDTPPSDNPLVPSPTPTPTHFGFIAIDNNHDLVVAIRGTQTTPEEKIDAETALVPWKSEGQVEVNVERGFRDLYDTLQLWYPGTNQVEDKDAILVASFKTITMIGHSLGSSLVTLYGAHVAAAKKQNKNVIIYTLASPRVGDKTFVDYYQKAGPQTYRIYNEPDTVPNSPSSLLGYEHVSAEEVPLNSLDYPLIARYEACWHSLYTYLFLLKNPKQDTIDQDIIDHGCLAPVH
ncbi:lipase family protein [Mucilaginibacter sp. HC2]|uniref:lipase family protein n=1 Tax=Mucilaginibacter inviolabilis TaxID=2714892 RepID=UPI00140763FE|nr:lipase family protein [Mucilaginibacter inviolabilis]NHA04146.1 lipase family protein [Mucilaginibacter inviolabilis]